MEYFSFIFVLFEVTVTKWFKVHTIVLCSSRDLPHPLLPSSSFQLFSLHGKVSCCFTIDDEVAAFVERGEHNSFRTGLDRRYLGSCRDSILLQLKNWSMVSLALFAEGGIQGFHCLRSNSNHFLSPLSIMVFSFSTILFNYFFLLHAELLKGICKGFRNICCFLQIIKSTQSLVFLLYKVLCNVQRVDNVSRVLF